MILLAFFCTSASAQLPIATIQPDAVASGMTIALEIMARASDSGAFGKDGLQVAGTSVELLDPADSNRIILGPIVTSWNGRLIQVAVIVLPTAHIGPLPFRVRTANSVTLSDTLNIVIPSSNISVSGGAILGDGNFGLLSRRNTLVVDSMRLSNAPQAGANFIFSTIDPDPQTPGNTRYLPVIVLSRGPIRITDAQLSVDADTMNGGPGGGGGGHGNLGIGGAGYTGGGSDTLGGGGSANLGSASNPVDSFGGSGPTGVRGGGSEFGDQGGGGGTGCPFGLSGRPGANADSSRLGGYGGGSGGGELAVTPNDVIYGGGGGGFGSDGNTGVGVGNNGGHKNGGRFLVPLQGGSGGGAGNAFNEASNAGSGGGGGGALALISFDSLVFTRSSSGTGATFSAAGGRGISGKGPTAGGGGGSGGGIYIASPLGISDLPFDVNATGGTHGKGGNPKGLDGGDGGLGVFRIDGPTPDSCAFCRVEAMRSGGLSLSPNKLRVASPTLVLRGFSNDATNLTDSIRIYFRDRHSNWRFVDTVRFAIGRHFEWKKTIPLLHDSVLYVAVLEKVFQPTRAIANFEPAWLMSHVSLGIIPHQPSPFLRTSPDTLRFDCTKIGFCAQAAAYLRNEGEQKALIDSIVITPPDRFTLLSSNKFALGFYESDSLLLKFCPLLAKKDTAVLTIYSNDSARKIILIGCGLSKKDSVNIKPSLLDFGRVHVGVCDTLTVTLHSIGPDTATIKTGALLQAPFELLDKIDSLVMPPGDSVHLRVKFCPTDTSTASASFDIGGDYPKLRTQGIGVRAILFTPDTIHFGGTCIGRCVSVIDTIENFGNDTLRVTSFSNVDPSVTVAPPLPWIVAPHTIKALVYTFCPSSAGSYQSTRSLVSNDTTRSIVFVGESELLQVKASALHFGVICATDDSLSSLILTSASSDSITLDTPSIALGSRFQFVNQPAGTKLASGASVSFPIRFRPSVVGSFVDTLLLHLSNRFCDTTLHLVLAGASTLDSVVLLDSALDFGIVQVDSCRLDSTLVANPCGPDVRIWAIKNSGDFSRIEPTEDTILLPSHGSAKIIYKFCPSRSGNISSIANFATETGDTLRLALNGEGNIVTRNQSSTLILSSTVGQAGFVQPMLVSLRVVPDTLTINALQATLHYDPSVVQPVGIGSAVSQNSGYAYLGSIPKQGEYAISISGSPLVPGVIGEVSWMPLVALQDTTTIFATGILSQPAYPTANLPGLFQVVGCGDLSGHVLIAGNYALLPAHPNPAHDFVELKWTIGADGPVTIAIFNGIGEKEGEIHSSDFFKASTYTERISLSKYPKGVHFFRIESSGFRAVQAVVVQ
jgi:hypothetical protein